MSEESVVAKEEVKNHNEKYMQSLVLDSHKIREEVPFVFTKLDKDLAGIGLLLPKEVERTDKAGNVIGIDQEWKPYFITSEGKVEPVNRDFKEEYNIEFEAIPEDLDLRWQVESIEKFLQREEPDLKHDLGTVFNLIYRDYEKYVAATSKTWNKVQALWDIGTYFFLLFDFFPIMEKTGHKGSGKTKYMKISRQFTFNASPIMVNPTESSLFRDTHDKRYTKYVDEAEKIWRYNANSKSIESDSRAELLNASVIPGSKVPRTEKIGGRFKPVHYSAYSPTLIGSIYGLRGATADRAITQICVKNSRDDPRGEREPNPKDSFYQDIRNNLYWLLLELWQDVEKSYKNYENDTDLKSRDYNIWKPLLVLAQLIEEELHDEIQQFAEEQSLVKRAENLDENSLDYKLIESTYKLLREADDNWVALKEIAQVTDPYSPPHSKTVASHLDKLGLRDYKNRRSKGVGYEILLENFEAMIKQTYPDVDFSTFSAFATSKNEVVEEKEETVEMKEDEENTDTMKQKNSHNEANEGNEANVENKATKAALLEYLENHDNEADKQSIVEHFGEEIESLIKRMETEGDLFEPKPDKVRLLQ